MIIKTGICGASGRMGLELSSLLAPGYTVDGATLLLQEAITRNANLTAVEGVPTRRLNDSALHSVQLWIDFSSPEATLELMKLAQAPLFIGTTGFNDKQKRVIQEYASRYPVALAANTSPGMTWIRSVFSKVPLNSADPFQCVLEEDHHQAKKDAPSGTALELARILSEHQLSPRAIHSNRLGGIIGNHRVRLVARYEEIIIEHRVLDRRVFAVGAIEAALRLTRRPPGLYLMEDL